VAEWSTGYQRCCPQFSLAERQDHQASAGKEKISNVDQDTSIRQPSLGGRETGNTKRWVPMYLGYCIPMACSKQQKTKHGRSSVELERIV
jgi:hypothetical protein